MIEAGVVLINCFVDGHPVYWHLPDGRTGGSLPDSRKLWEILWELRRVDSLGFAHSHPGSGIPCPSHIDITTFCAIESGLGRRLDWWITSADRVIKLRWKGPDKHDYESCLVQEPSWANQLRQYSKDKNDG